MPRYLMPIAQDTVTQGRWAALSPFVQGYVECALFCGVEHPKGHPDADRDKWDDAPFEAIHPETIAKMEFDCLGFTNANAELLDKAYAGDYDAKQAGSDFWWTRNGHGVGFKDRDQLPEDVREALDDAAHNFADYDLYTGDDGLIYGHVT